MLADLYTTTGAPVFVLSANQAQSSVWKEGKMSKYSPTENQLLEDLAIML